MPICSYLVIPRRGTARAVEARLDGLPGCDVARATNRDALLLVTETGSREEDEALRARIEDVEDVHALILTFGEIGPGEAPDAGRPEPPGDDRSLPLVRRDPDDRGDHGAARPPGPARG